MRLAPSPYVEKILLACPSDSVIKHLAALKASGSYSSSSLANSFPDGLDAGDKRHHFYFLAKQEHFLLYLNLVPHTPKATALLLVGIRDLNARNEWAGLNDDLSEQRQKEVLQWFKSAIEPALVCR